MILNGKALTVGEFKLMDEATGWQASKMMQAESPTWMLLCHWIVLRRETKNLTWDEYQKREVDWEQLAEELEVTDPNQQSGNGLEQKPVSANTGESALQPLTN